jgi:hypothetical protein
VGPESAEKALACFKRSPAGEAFRAIEDLLAEKVVVERYRRGAVVEESMAAIAGTAASV